MGLIIRQGFKSSIGFYLGIVLGAVNTLFVSTQYLSPDQLAISRILLENSLIFAAFAHLGTPYIADRFFSIFRSDTEQHHGFLVFLLLLPLVGIAIFGITFLFFQNVFEDYFRAKSATIIPYLWLLFPLTIIWIYVSVLEAYSRNNARIAVPTFLREVVFRLANMLLIFLFALGWISYDQFLYLLIVSLGLILLGLFGYIWHLGKLYLVWDTSKWNKKLMLEMLGFGAIVILGGVGANLVLFLDRNILANQMGTTAVAIFTVATYIASIIEVPSKAVRNISGPIMATAIQQNDQSKIEELYKKSALNMLLIGGLAFWLIASNLNSLLGILPKSEIYAQGKWVVLLIGAAKWIDMSLGLNTEMMAYSKYFKINTLLVVLMAVLVVYTNTLLVPIYGVNGAAMATSSITLLWAVLKLSFVRWKFGILPFSREDWEALGALILVALAGFLIPNFGSNSFVVLISIGCKSLIMALIFVFLVVKFKLSDDLYFLYQNQVKSRFSKK
ncbi:MAG: lipopolysaccharide biosynthesis protein [Runella sp.]